MSLITEAVKDKIPATATKKELEAMLQACKKVSREKQIMRAIITGAIGGEKGKRLISMDVMCSEYLLNLGIGNESSDEDEELEEGRLVRLSKSRR